MFIWLHSGQKAFWMAKVKELGTCSTDSLCPYLPKDECNAVFYLIYINCHFCQYELNNECNEIW